MPGIHRAEFSPATGEAPRVCIWNWKTGPEQTTVLISSAGYRHNRSPGRLSNMEGWTEMKGREEKKKRGGRKGEEGRREEGRRGKGKEGGGKKGEGVW